MLLTCSQYLPNAWIPLPVYQLRKATPETTTDGDDDNNKPWAVKRYRIFSLFPVHKYYLCKLKVFNDVISIMPSIGFNQHSNNVECLRYSDCNRRFASRFTCQN